MPRRELHDLDLYGAAVGDMGGTELCLGEVVAVGAVAVELLEAGWWSGCDVSARLGRLVRFCICWGVDFWRREAYREERSWGIGGGHGHSPSRALFDRGSEERGGRRSSHRSVCCLRMVRSGSRRLGRSVIA